MKKVTLSGIIVLAVIIGFTMGCKTDVNTDPIAIDGLTMENFPRLDGSTSTRPLYYLVAARLLDLEYEWAIDCELYEVVIDHLWDLYADLQDKLWCTQTHEAIINLIDNRTDLIIVARKMSADEKQYANNKGVSLIETPIAIDALDFLINPLNTVNSLTVEQVQNIYLGNITNWSEVGGSSEGILPFIRNANSGSQEMMNEIVMSSTGVADWELSLVDAEAEISGMYKVYEELTSHPDGICFTPHYYKEFMVRDAFGKDKIKTLAVNGITHNKNSIEKKTYPFVADVYVSIRSDVNRTSMTYKLYEWLQTEAGKSVIRESGYVPN